MMTAAPSRAPPRPTEAVSAGIQAVSVERLAVSIAGAGVEVVRPTTLAIAPGEILGLVGESGSGKSTLALAMLWHAGRGLEITAGDVRLRGQSLRALTRTELREIRGRDVSYVPQDPARALNPGFRIGDQLRDILLAHGAAGRGAALEQRVGEVLNEVHLSGDRAFLRRFPHQLSGGQQQRVVLAMAFACRPSLVVLDEPTTGLDVTTQLHVLDTVRAMCRGSGTAALYVSHDLAVVAALADRIAVIYAGAIVELGPTRVLVAAARHPYTRCLLAAVPDPRGRHAVTGIAGRAPSPGERPAGCAFAPRCDLVEPRCRQFEPDAAEHMAGHLARCWRAGAISALPRRAPAAARAPGTSAASLAVRDVTAAYGRSRVLHGVSLRVDVGSCVAVVGESGSGKTTLARCVAGMHPSHGGEITLGDVRLDRSAQRRTAQARRAVQYVFQTPYSALNPRRNVAEILGQWLDVLGSGTAADRGRRIAACLEQVGLGEDVLARYSDELSGGQQQRVALARALVCEPSFLVCDEITSALDVSVQASIVTLLEDLRRRQGLGLLFITHDLALVRSIADQVVVMRHGRIVEAGPSEAVFTAPSHDYTRALLRLTPSIDDVVDHPAG